MQDQNGEAAVDHCRAMPSWVPPLHMQVHGLWHSFGELVSGLQILEFDEFAWGGRLSLNSIFLAFLNIASVQFLETMSGMKARDAYDTTKLFLNMQIHNLHVKS